MSRLGLIRLGLWRLGLTSEPEPYEVSGEVVTTLNTRTSICTTTATYTAIQTEDSHRTSIRTTTGVANG